MPWTPADVALAGNVWTLVADYTATVDRPRGADCINLTGSANSAEFLVDPLHVEGTTPGGGTPGYPIAAGAAKAFGDVRSGGGAVNKVWARSAGATVRVVVDIG